MFDMRFIANPHWVDELRPLTGLEQAVRDYCATTRPGARPWTASNSSPRPDPRYWAAGKTYLTVAFGCTGGAIGRSRQRWKWQSGCVRPAFRRISVCDLASTPSDSVEDIRPLERVAVQVSE